MKAAAIRRSFVEYFCTHHHQPVSGSSLIPHNDPTLLFTNSGMVQFKDVFLGNEQCPYHRAVTTQCCMRAGGKHNDLDNVGYTARHHTFFEMLGNFSFGDYFKKQAIDYAWDFVTNVLHLPAQKLWITVHHSDDTAAAIWQRVGVATERIVRLDADNFWQMGNTGPCGPSSEIFYDHGREVYGGPPGSDEADGDRFVEIWNLVFMEYQRDAAGQLTALPRPSVDTGMGLERIAAVLQGVTNNYQTDLFASLLDTLQQITERATRHDHALHVLADHIRSSSFLIAEGIAPDNAGRGYVLRRIIRRALRHGYQLGLREPFFHRLVPPLCTEMGAAYPLLADKAPHIITTLQHEEKQFLKTLQQGMMLLDQALHRSSGKILDGETAFRLYDTCGFPFDLTRDICREQGFRVDVSGFELALARQRERSRSQQRFSIPHLVLKSSHAASCFIGYEHHHGNGRVVALLVDGKSLSNLNAGDDGAVVLDRTPFYAEGGGQVGDSGMIHGAGALFEVSATRKQDACIVHYGRMVEGRLQTDQTIEAVVDAARRTQIACHHSATHLLHAALHTELGVQAEQRGSQVSMHRLRFDFVHHEPLNDAQLMRIEQAINAEIRANTAITTKQMALEVAKSHGAMAIFGEKYGNTVRVVSMGTGESHPYSRELCGGTHAKRTGDLGVCHIVAESPVAAGIRRIEAVTADAAQDFYQDLHRHTQEILRLSKAGAVVQLAERWQRMMDYQHQMEQKLLQLQQDRLPAEVEKLLNQAQQHEDIRWICAQVSNYDAAGLRALVDRLRERLGRALILLASVHSNHGKIMLCSGCDAQTAKVFRADVLLRYVAQQIGGNGGGRADMAQGGGEHVNQLSAALNSVGAWIADQGR